MKRKEKRKEKRKKKKRKKEKEKKKKKRMVEKKEARNVSEQREKGWIHVIRVHDIIHSADNNTAGQQTLMNYPTQRQIERSR